MAEELTSIFQSIKITERHFYGIAPGKTKQLQTIVSNGHYINLYEDFTKVNIGFDCL